MGWRERKEAYHGTHGPDLPWPVGLGLLVTNHHHHGPGVRPRNCVRQVSRCSVWYRHGSASLTAVVCRLVIPTSRFGAGGGGHTVVRVAMTVTQIILDPLMISSFCPSSFLLMLMSSALLFLLLEPVQDGGAFTCGPGSCASRGRFGKDLGAFIWVPSRQTAAARESVSGPDREDGGVRIRETLMTPSL